MDGQILGLWVGIAITFVLGLINFLWGGGLLTRKDKVIVVNSEIYPEFLPKGVWLHLRDGPSVLISDPELSIEATCELVLKSGQQECEVKEVEAVLHRRTFNRLRRYFDLPHRNRLFLDPVNSSTDEALTTNAILQPKKTMKFKHRPIYRNSTDAFQKEYEKMENGSCPKSIELLLDKLQTNYDICWTRYDGKKLCWHYPDKWWCNLGKKLWG